jgi:hypothetical protein
MQERLSMLMVRRMGIAAPREAFARLYINDQYAGLYTLVESIDKGFLQRNLGEDGGYLYQYEYSGDVEAVPYVFNYLGDDPSLYVPIPFRPETHEDDPRPEYIERLAWTINETSDAAFRSAIEEYIDLEAFVRHVAVENFVAEIDGLLGDFGLNNFFLYRFDGRALFTFIPWDKSEAFKGGIDFPILHNVDFGPYPNRLMQRAMAYQDLYELYLNTLLACAQSASEPLASTPVGPGWLEREIAREYVQIRDAARADTVKPFGNETFEDAVAELIAFAQQRPPTVAAQVDGVRHPGTFGRRRAVPKTSGRSRMPTTFRR